jgi:endonuclease YncB( thermonuclease family)
MMLLAVMLAACSAFHAQTRLYGLVTQVVDGRTVMLDTGSGPVAVQLQFIDVPEPEQPFHTVVRDHLAKLTVGKRAEFVAARMVGGRMVGRVTVDGVDLSAQLLIDGAAWHEPQAQSGQPQPEAAEYAAHEGSAKEAKRGVWSIAGIKTPWQVRRERQEAAEREEAARRPKHARSFGINQYQTINRPGTRKSTVDLNSTSGRDAWLGVMSGSEGDFTGLRTHNDPSRDLSVVYTSHSLVEFDSGRGKQKMDCRALYGRGSQNLGIYRELYAIAFRAVSSDFNFSRKKSILTVTADGRSFSLGAPFGYKGQSAIGTTELFYYTISKANLKRIVSAKSVEFKVNNLSGKVPDATRDLFRQLLEATE